MWCSLWFCIKHVLSVILRYTDCEWVIVVYHQISNMSMRWWWCPLYTKPTCLIADLVINNNQSIITHSQPCLCAFIINSIHVCFVQSNTCTVVISFSYIFCIWRSIVIYILGIRAQDPCTDNQILNDPTRSVDYALGTSDQEQCDRLLSEDWYRLEGDGNIPTECPAVLRCGSTGGIWLNGKFSIWFQMPLIRMNLIFDVFVWIKYVKWSFYQCSWHMK